MSSIIRLPHLLAKRPPLNVLLLLLILSTSSSRPLPSTSTDILDDSGRWNNVDSILKDEQSRRTFPGAVAAVIGKQGILYLKPFGNFTYEFAPPMNPGRIPPMTINTVFDMASLTKVLMTTTAVMQFYQRDTKISDPSLLGPAFAANGKGTITMLNLLLHNAGLPPDPNPNYWNTTFPNECPETKKYRPGLNFSCQVQIYQALMQQTLDNPVGSVYVYSDLSMITAMYVVGRLAQTFQYVAPSSLLPACRANLSETDPEIYQCYYEAYCREFIIKPVGMSNSGFLPPPSTWGNIAPTWNDTFYLHRVIQGVVSDGNSYALGGIAGHGGLFASILDTIKLARLFMWPSSDSKFVNSTTWSLFSAEYNHTQSSRALGWDTNDCTFPNSYCGCSTLSPLTWTHTGFTGTQICGDPTRQVVTILLTNRCYPGYKDKMLDIQRARQRFNDAVRQVLDASSG